MISRNNYKIHLLLSSISFLLMFIGKYEAVLVTTLMLFVVWGIYFVSKQNNNLRRAYRRLGILIICFLLSVLIANSITSWCSNTYSNYCRILTLIHFGIAITGIWYALQAIYDYYISFKRIMGWGK